MYYTSHPAFLRAHSEKRSPSLSLAEKDENAEGHKIVETLKILVAGKDSEAILRLINRVQRDNDRWWEVVGNKGSVEMVKALAFASSDSDILIRTLHRVESKYRSTEMYNTVIASLVKSGKSILAFKEFYSMQHIGVKPNGDTYGLLVDAYYLKNNWFKILGLFEDMKRESVSPSANAYNSAMRALTKHGHWAQALRLFGQFKREGGGGEGLSARSPLTHAALGACNRGSCWEVALQILIDYCMHNNGGGGGGGTMALPDSRSDDDDERSLTVAHTTFISTCARAGIWNLALSHLNDMKNGIVTTKTMMMARRNVYGSGQSSLPPPNRFTYNAAIASLARRSMEKATEGRQHEGSQQDHGAEGKGDHEEGDNDMPKQDHDCEVKKLDPVQDANSSPSPEKWRWLKALELLAECKNTPALQQRRREDAQSKSRSEADGKTPLLSASSALAPPPPDQGLVIPEDEDDEELMQFNIALENEEAANPIDGVGDDGVVENSRSKGQEGERQVREGNPLSSSSTGVRNSHTGDRQRGATSNEVYERKDGDDQEVEALGVDAVIYNTAIHVCVQNKAVKQAIGLLGDMQRESLQPDHYTFTSLIKGAGSIGKWQLALALFDDYKHRHTPPSSGDETQQHRLSLESYERRNQQRSARMVYFAIIDALWEPPQQRAEEDSNGGSSTKKTAVGGGGGGGGTSTLISRQNRADAIYLEMLQKRLVNTRIESIDDFTSVDFHTLSGPVARSAMRWFLGEIVRLKNRVDELGDLHLIVGKGQKTGTSLLGPVLISMLEHEVTPPLAAKVSSENSGRLIISRRDVKNWIKGEGQRSKLGGERRRGASTEDRESSDSRGRGQAKRRIRRGNKRAQ